MRLVAEPRIDDSGVRKSCETDASSVLRTRSVSVAVLALTISRASEARSRAAAVCSTSVSSKARASESSGGASFSLATPITPSVLSPMRKRHEVPRDDRQGAGVGAGRLDVTVGPARRGHRGGVERILRRPCRGQRQIIALRKHDDDRTSQAGVDFAGGAFRHGIERRKARQAPGEFIKPPHRAHAAGRDSRLLAHASGQRRTDNGNDEENHQRQQFIRLGDGEGVERLDKEEIVDEKRQHRGIDRRPDAEAHGGDQDRQQEDHREIGDWREPCQQFADGERHRDCERRVKEWQRA